MNPLEPEQFLATTMEGLTLKYVDADKAESLAEEARMQGESPMDAKKVILNTEEAFAQRIAADEGRGYALAKHLGEDFEDIEDENDNKYTSGREEYLVLTDEEADDAAREQINESLWAFNASFITDFCGLSHRCEQALQKMQEELCEEANELIHALVGDGFDKFCEQAIGADGRGHFLAGYDHEENEIQFGEKTFYVYRQN